MLSTAWRMSGALKCSIQGTIGTRLFSFHQASRSWYKNLDDDARKAIRLRYTDANRVRRSKPEVLKADLRAQRLKYKEDNHFRRRKTILRWCAVHSWLREQLPWKTHQPVYYSQRVEHFCYGCNWVRTSGAKLWWVPLADTVKQHGSHEYLCNDCYTKNDWDEVMPTGYEDLRTIKDITTRMKHLGHPAPTNAEGCGSPADEAS